jgi:hypothetical protein
MLKSLTYFINCQSYPKDKLAKYHVNRRQITTSSILFILHFLGLDYILEHKNKFIRSVNRSWLRHLLIIELVA